MTKQSAKYVMQVVDKETGYQCAFTLDGKSIGDEKFAIFLTEERGISPECIGQNSRCSIGYSEKDGKWYGWSHRAIFGFDIGSKVTLGDCAHTADTPEGLIEEHVKFFADMDDEERSKLRRAECQILPDRTGIRILPAPLRLPTANSIEEAIEAIETGDDSELELKDVYEDSFYEIECGRGEWTAKSVLDARQMAIDFARGVA